MGLDLALRYTGVSILAENGIPLRHFTLKHLLTGGKEAVTEAERLQRIVNNTDKILEAVKTFKIAYVGIEGYAHNQKWQAHQIGEMAGVVKVHLAMAAKIIPEVVSPGAARKHVFGYGGSIDKKDIERIVQEGFGVSVENDHEADAFVIARYTFDSAVAREKEVEHL